ncbi:HD domain-containing protein [Thalassospira sp. MA62]|nr:HD domain-containing protein [Thalassospira sp. MA62]
MATSHESLTLQLQQQERLHHLLSSLLNRFLTTEIADFKKRVDQSLAELGQYFAVDRVYVFDYDFTNQVCHNTFEWCAEGITAEMDNLQDVPIDVLPEWVNTHVAGETMYIPRVADLPEGSAVRAILEPQAIQSLLAVPMMQGKSCQGFVGFDSVISERTYTEYEQQALQDFSNALLGAVERHRIEAGREEAQRVLAEREKELIDYQEGLVRTLLRLSALRNNETGNHIERVQDLSTLFATILYDHHHPDVTPLFIEGIRLAAPLHDIGKISVPDAILLKANKLSDQEWVFMRDHVRVGGEVLKDLQTQFPQNYFIQMAYHIALYHHERWDGTGYNQGLKGEDIPLAARIVTIIDVYDALRTVRPYKPAYSHEDAILAMRDMEGAFDPTLFELFLLHQEEIAIMFDQTFKAH